MKGTHMSNIVAPVTHPELSMRQVESLERIADNLRRSEAEVFENGVTHVRASVYVGCGQTVTGPVIGWTFDLSEVSGGWITLVDYTGELITRELSQVSEYDIWASWDRV